MRIGHEKRDGTRCQTELRCSSAIKASRKRHAHQRWVVIRKPQVIDAAVAHVAKAVSHKSLPLTICRVVEERQNSKRKSGEAPATDEKTHTWRT